MASEQRQPTGDPASCNQLQIATIHQPFFIIDHYWNWTLFFILDHYCPLLIIEIYKCGYMFLPWDGSWSIWCCSVLKENTVSTGRQSAVTGAPWYSWHWRRLDEDRHVSCNSAAPKSLLLSGGVWKWMLNAAYLQFERPQALVNTVSVHSFCISNWYCDPCYHDPVSPCPRHWQRSGHWYPCHSENLGHLLEHTQF